MDEEELSEEEWHITNNLKKFEFILCVRLNTVCWRLNEKGKLEVTVIDRPRLRKKIATLTGCLADVGYQFKKNKWLPCWP
ncbi:hypothetical protein A4A49_10963 [Nicotiana attenuata]|uniref:Uncharacterized protein n=1 Tax=Nicotiana attenuata TaxID=49451 RepID=A0A1J6IY74_NICAT|nr:hypothetical protein A4A49_10963 [Nicotiana attenuata]